MSLRNPNRNMVFLQGQLDKEPKFKTLQSGALIADFSIRNTTFGKEKAEGHYECTAFKNQWPGAYESLEGLKADDHVQIEGRLRSAKWETNDGKIKYYISILADKLIPLEWHGVAKSTAPPSVRATAPPVTEDDIPF